MGKKEAYKEKNLQYLQVLSTRADICSLPCGIFYEVLQAGTGTASPLFVASLLFIIKAA